MCSVCARTKNVRSHTQSIDLVVVCIRALVCVCPYDSIAHLCEQQHRIRVVGLYRLLKVSMWPTTLPTLTVASERAWAGAGARGRHNHNTMDKRMKTIEKLRISLSFLFFFYRSLVLATSWPLSCSPFARSFPCRSAHSYSWNSTGSKRYSMSLTFIGVLFLAFRFRFFFYSLI